MSWGIKFRPIKPRSPHLNGKVERTQRADLEEFWPTVDPKSPDIQLKREINFAACERQSSTNGPA